MIPFNKPHITGKEAHNMYQSVYNGHISGNGQYTKFCQNFFQEKWGFTRCLMTTSCTDALEMAALLLDIKPGDEVIVPSYTFVSTALAFVRQGATIVFADSRQDHPGIDEKKIESLITSKTKVIVPVHYAGVACDMDYIMQLADKYGLYVVEDAAQAIDSYYKGRPLGSIGHLAAFSFHETKNIQCGEGGLLAINDRKFIKRAEILWEKGTNRAEFFRGEVNKYGWVDTGSSFLPADYVAGFLFAQLEDLDRIQNRRREIWNLYYDELKDASQIKLPIIPDHATNNGHMFYCLCGSLNERTELISYLKESGISAVFHYLCLNESPYYVEKCGGIILPNAKVYDECLVRLPMFYDITDEEIKKITDKIKIFYNGI